MPISQNTQSCNDTFTITVNSQDGYWPKKIFFDRYGNGTGTDYNTVYSDNMTNTPPPNNVYPKYYRNVRQCAFGGTSTDVNNSFVADKLYYIDKADYLNSNGTQMTTMNYTVESEYRCCFYLMVDMYDSYTWEGNSWHNIHGPSATVFMDSFYVNWTLATNQSDMIIGMHIPLSAGFFSYNNNTDLINNTASSNGFIDDYNGITTCAGQLVSPSSTGLKGIPLTIQSTTLPDIPYITYTVSRYKRMADKYRDVQAVFVKCDLIGGGTTNGTFTSIAAAHTLSPCIDYDIATSATSTPARPWLTPQALSNYTYTTHTLSTGSGNTSSFNFLTSGVNIIMWDIDDKPRYTLSMWVLNGMDSYANLISTLSKAVTSTSGDSHINIGDFFYDARDGQIKYRMRVLPATPDRIYDSNHVFYDTAAMPNIIALVDCDNEGNEQIRSVLPNDPDYIGVEKSLTYDNHGMYKFVSANNGVLYTFFKTLRVCADGYVTHYYFQNGEPKIDCEWNVAQYGIYSLNGCSYDQSMSSYYNSTWWYHIDSPTITTCAETFFPDYYQSVETEKTYLFAYQYNQVDIETMMGSQITDYTYDATTGVASITVNSTVYYLESDENESQIDYYERQTEYVMYKGDADTNNAMTPNTMYCNEEGAPHILFAMGNYGGHVVGWQAINGPRLSTNERVSTDVACCDVITPLVEYGYERPFYYYVIKDSDKTKTSSSPYNPIPPINTYGLKRCAQNGYSIYNFLRKVSNNIGYVPRKTAIFGTGTPILDDYVPDDAIESVYIALVKISDSYLIHNEDGEVIGLPEDLSCADIIYGANGLSDYMKNGYIDDGSVYIFVYARPSISVSSNIASYTVLHGESSSATIVNINYTLKSLLDDEGYTVSHDTFYKDYLKAPLFTLFTIETSLSNIGSSCGMFYYNNELIASFSQVLTYNYDYVVPNSYLCYDEFVGSSGFYIASSTDFEDGIVYYDVSGSKAAQVLYLNSYFFTKQSKIEFSEIGIMTTTNNGNILVSKPYGFTYIFPKIVGTTLQTVRRHTSSNINKLTRWLPQGTCTKGVWGSSTKTIYGQEHNTVMFHQANSESLQYLSLTVTFTPLTSGSSVTLTFDITSIANEVESSLTMTTPSIEIYDATPTGQLPYSLLGSIENRNGIPYITNLQIRNTSNNTTYGVYGTIRVIMMDEIYNEDYYPYRVAGYTFSDFHLSISGYSDIIVFDYDENYLLSTSIINGWNTIHTYLNEATETGTDGCSVGDEKYMAKIWPKTLYTDSNEFTDEIRIKINGYTPTSSDYDTSSDEDIEQNVFLCFTVESQSAGGSGTDTSFLGIGRYNIKVRFYDIVHQYFERVYNYSDENLNLYYRSDQPLSDDNGMTPNYVAFDNSYITKDTSSTNYVDYMNILGAYIDDYSGIHDIYDALSSYIDFDEETSEVILKNILGGVKVETSWRFGVYNSSLTTNDTSNHTIFYYPLGIPLVLNSVVQNGIDYIPQFAGYDNNYPPYSYGIEENTTFDEIADRYDIQTSTSYSCTLPSIHFNISDTEYLLAYSGYNGVISPNTLYIPTFEINSNEYSTSALEDSMDSMFSFGNVNGGGAGSVNSHKVVLRQSSRYLKEGYNQWDAFAFPYSTNTPYNLRTQFGFVVMGIGYEKYLQVKTIYTNSRKVSFDIEGFGCFRFVFNNGSIDKVLCDFNEFLVYGKYNTQEDYEAALDVIKNLNILVYNVTESDNIRKYVFEIGPLPPNSLIDYYRNIKNVFCVWNHINGENYYYNISDRTQNFVYDYSFIDTLSTPSNNINLQFETDESGYDNVVFKAYTNFDATSFNPYDGITVLYDEA